MSSLKNKFSILTLVLLSTQLVPQVLRPSAASGALEVEALALSWKVAQPSALQDEPSALKCDRALSQKVAIKGGWEASHGLMSAALWPLDLMKKASVCVLKSPYLLLMVTSALLPNADGYRARVNLYEKLYKNMYPKVPLRLTEDWDTTSCKGRVLNANETETLQDQKLVCKTIGCISRVQNSQLCEDERSQLLCDSVTCAPHVIGLGAARAAQSDIDACVKKLCSEVGKPYTGHFDCITYKKYTHNTKQRKKINRAILKAEECFDRFCQEDAHDACPHKASALQLFFGIAPCNEDLCVGRFVPDEDKEIYPGFFESLEDVGYVAMRQCKKIKPYKRHCRHY